MAKMNLDLSDSLFELHRSFQEVGPELHLDAEQANILVTLLKQLGDMARDLENEVSCKRWNDLARSERAEEVRRIAELADDPQSNVALFPVIPRPFSDGGHYPPGGAA